MFQFPLHVGCSSIG